MGAGKSLGRETAMLDTGFYTFTLTESPHAAGAEKVN